VTPSTREGFLYGLAAYGWWGLVPFYFHWLGTVSPFDILAHRIVWSLVLLAIVLTLTRRWPDTLRCVTTPRLLLPLIASALLVGYNWFLYILGVMIGQIVQSSLGYFILPLVSVVLGMLIFHERLRPLQQVAIAFAGAGVISLTFASGVFPWLAVGIALSFSMYGVIRKKLPVDGLIGLAVETAVLAPFALAYLAISYSERGEMEDADMLFKLSLSGVVTAVPLFCFGQAAQRLPFATLGFMQYLAPSLQFLLALYLFNEKVIGGWHNYGIVWIALIVFSIDSYRWYRRQVQG
jgi:chloramphenicol-sensitive protein RarD